MPGAADLRKPGEREGTQRHDDVPDRDVEGVARRQEVQGDADELRPHYVRTDPGEPRQDDHSRGRSRSPRPGAWCMKDEAGITRATIGLRAPSVGVAIRAAAIGGPGSAGPGAQGFPFTTFFSVTKTSMTRRPPQGHRSTSSRKTRSRGTAGAHVHLHRPDDGATRSANQSFTTVWRVPDATSRR